MRQNNANAAKLEKLEAKLQQKNEVVAELLQEHVELKKLGNLERSVKCILRWALGWKVLFPPTWEPIHGQFETVGREARALAIGTC